MHGQTCSRILVQQRRGAPRLSAGELARGHHVPRGRGQAKVAERRLGQNAHAWRRCGRDGLVLLRLLAAHLAHALRVHAAEPGAINATARLVSGSVSRPRSPAPAARPALHAAPCSVAWLAQASGGRGSSATGARAHGQVRLTQAPTPAGADYSRTRATRGARRTCRAPRLAQPSARRRRRAPPRPRRRRQRARPPATRSAAADGAGSLAGCRRNARPRRARGAAAADPSSQLPRR